MNREVICFDAVAPARERGLKCIIFVHNFLLSCRSREGAWIEIDHSQSAYANYRGRSREGAWIEIYSNQLGVLVS